MKLQLSSVPISTHRRPKVATTVTRRLLHLPIIERQKLHSQRPLNLRSPRGWYRAQKPLNPANTEKYEKDTNHRPQVAPRKYEKKYREKNTKMAEKLPFLYLLSVIFSYFRGGRPGVGDLYFFRNFFVFPGFRGFWGSVPPPRARRFKLQRLRVKSREMTAFAESCHDREMQRP